MKKATDIETAFEGFRSVAVEFCGVVDSASHLDRVELLSRVYEILPRLIHRAMELPDISLSDDEVRSDNQIRETRMKGAEWTTLYELLKGELGDWNLYWQVFDPTKHSEAICGSLADDIADIYRDVKEGLGCYNPDLALEKCATSGWRFLYYSHWGPHAMDALRTIHFLLEDKRQ